MLVTWRYRTRSSFIQSLDPRAYFIFYACFLVSALMFWDLRVHVFFLSVALFFLLNSRLTWREIRRPLLFIGAFIVFFSFLTMLTGRGGMEVYDQEHVIRRIEAGFTILGWRPVLMISVERIFFALSQLARVFSIAVMTILIPYTINPALYGITFRGLGLPDKIAYAMDLTMRYIPSFGRDFQLTLDAQRARGYELENLRGGLIAQVRKIIPLIVPVTIHAIVASEDIIDAMDLRAFGVRPRTWLEQLVYQHRDYLLIIFGVAMLVVSLAAATLGLGYFWYPEGWAAQYPVVP
jgi:energy-coupling factor transport system permease protein